MKHTIFPTLALCGIVPIFSGCSFCFGSSCQTTPAQAPFSVTTPATTTTPTAITTTIQDLSVLQVQFDTEYVYDEKKELWKGSLVGTNSSTNEKKIYVDDINARVQATIAEKYPDGEPFPSGTAFLYQTQMKDFPIVVLSESILDTDAKDLRYITYNVQTDTFNLLPSVNAIGLSFGGKVSSPSGRYVAFAESPLEADNGESTRLYLFDLYEDAVYLLKTLPKGETFNRGFGGISQDIDMAFTSDTELTFTVFEQPTRLDYAEETKPVKRKETMTIDVKKLTKEVVN